MTPEKPGGGAYINAKNDNFGLPPVEGSNNGRIYFDKYEYSTQVVKKMLRLCEVIVKSY